MSTITHEPSTLVRRPSWVDARNLWASVAIASIWVAVVLTVLFGPNLENVTAGGDHSTVPSGIFVGLFALFATWPVAKYGFERKPQDS